MQTPFAKPGGPIETQGIPRNLQNRLRQAGVSPQKTRAKQAKLTELSGMTEKYTPSLKLTWPLKIGGWKMNFLLEWPGGVVR